MGTGGGARELLGHRAAQPVDRPAREALRARGGDQAVGERQRALLRLGRGEGVRVGVEGRVKRPLVHHGRHAVGVHMVVAEEALHLHQAVVLPEVEAPTTTGAVRRQRRVLVPGQGVVTGFDVGGDRTDVERRALGGVAEHRGAAVAPARAEVDLPGTELRRAAVEGDHHARGAQRPAAREHCGGQLVEELEAHRVRRRLAGDRGLDAGAEPPVERGADQSGEAGGGRIGRDGEEGALEVLRLHVEARRVEHPGGAVGPGEEVAAGGHDRDRSVEALGAGAVVGGGPPDGRATTLGRALDGRGEPGGRLGEGGHPRMLRGAWCSSSGRR